MTASLPPMIRFQPLVAGASLPGGKVYFYQAGTLTPQAAYAADGTTPLANPLTLDANGATYFLLGDTLTYKIDLTDSIGTPVTGWPVDQITSFNAGFVLSVKKTDLAATGPGQGAGMVGYKAPFTGAVAQTLQSREDNHPITPESFGAVGDGVTDDTVALQALTNASQGKTCFLGGVYRITAKLTGSLTNCTFLGVKGKTKITSSFSDILATLIWQPSDVNNVTIDGITFESTATDTSSPYWALFQVYQNNVNNLTIQNCTFTCPNISAAAIAIYPRINSTDLAHTAHNLRIINNDFISCGSICISLMNRGSSDPAPNGAFTDVVIDGNYAYNTGCIGGSTYNYGFFVTLDGYGSRFSVTNNKAKYLTTAQSCIENIAWSYGVISGNEIDASGTSVIGFSGPPDRTGSIGKYVSISDNVFRLGSGNVVIEAHDYCTFTGNKIITTSPIPLYVRYSNNNKISDLMIDATGAETVYSFVRFQTSATNNTVANCVFITDGTGSSNMGLQETGSVGNIIYDCYTTGGPYTNYSSVAITDANQDYTLNTNYVKFYSFTGSLTATRNITLPLAFIARGVTVRNSTGQSLNFSYSGAVNSATVTNGNTMTLLYDADNNAIRGY
jgi:hypothetical protein